MNHNGRWAPPWRRASELIAAGAIGEVVSVSHLDDRDFGFIVGLPYDATPHFVIGDYSIHWIDIIRCWLDAEPESVRAVEYRTPNQPAASRQPWGAVIQFDYADGRSAVIRQVGCSRTAAPCELFWIHGTEGTLRGQVGDAGFAGDDWLELEYHGSREAVPLQGRWFIDGFAAAMGELLNAVHDDRPPSHSAEHHLLSLRMTLAACFSAEHAGRPVMLDELDDGAMAANG